MYLTGAKKFNLDAKGRLSLPSDYRREFDGKVCLVPVQDALYGFTPEGYQTWVEGLFPNGFNPRDKRDDRLRRGLNQNTVTVEIDSVGRVALGKVEEGQRSRLGLDREVEVIGNGDHFEVWNAEKWEKSQEGFADELGSLMFDA